MCLIYEPRALPTIKKFSFWILVKVGTCRLNLGPKEILPQKFFEKDLLGSQRD
jgi:hypothetical protein